MKLARNPETSYFIGSMNIKQKIISCISLGILAVVPLTLSFTPPASALGNNGCETDTAIIKCTNVKDDATSPQETGLWSILLTAINLLTAGVGVVAIAGIIYASILYTSAGGSQEQVKKSMGIITNVVIGIVAYALMYSGLNFLIPGGIFN